MRVTQRSVANPPYEPPYTASRDRSNSLCPVIHVATARGTDGNSFYGLAIGFTVLTGAFAVGGISGGAFNPAIALGAMVTGLFEWGNIWIYLLADLLGAAAAAYTFLYVLPAEKPGGDAVQAASTE